ncbi:uncharacterized protein LOC143642157 [Callospermophilus lateralis]|uniref:uncharacterized protein LOC143642157 n=1 Tax=Callospermophilus lateralis TaxID=76772 RepID=UPI0040547F20
MGNKKKEIALQRAAARTASLTGITFGVKSGARYHIARLGAPERGVLKVTKMSEHIFNKKNLLTLQDKLEPPLFPIQKGSLNLLRQKWESSDYQRSEYCPEGSRCRLLQLRESKLLKPKGEEPSASEPLHPSRLPCRAQEETLSAEPREKGPEHKRDHSREHSHPEVLKEDSLTSRRRIERFSIALDELRSVFEAPKSEDKPVGPAEYDRKVRSYTLRVSVCI